MKTAMIAPNVTLYLKGEEKGEARDNHHAETWSIEHHCTNTEVKTTPQQISHCKTKTVLICDWRDGIGPYKFMHTVNGLLSQKMLWSFIVLVMPGVIVYNIYWQPDIQRLLGLKRKLKAGLLSLTTKLRQISWNWEGPNWTCTITKHLFLGLFNIYIYFLNGCSMLKCLIFVYKWNVLLLVSVAKSYGLH